MEQEYMRVFRAFTDKSRVRVLEILSKGEQCACVLLEDLNISQPTLSHHMKILCDSGIVTSRRVGHWNYYSINAEGCTYASSLLNAVKNQHMDRLLRVIRVLYRLNPLEFLKDGWKITQKPKEHAEVVFLRAVK